jgi:hypothetical protein
MMNQRAMWSGAVLACLLSFSAQANILWDCEMEQSLETITITVADAGSKGKGESDGEVEVAAAPYLPEVAADAVDCFYQDNQGKEECRS